MVSRIPTKDKEPQPFTSGKMRRAEILARRKARNPVVEWVDPQSLPENWPKGAIAANMEGLAMLHPYAIIPYCYDDTAFTCKDCGAENVWRATQQKWYLEVAKGHLDSKPVRCLACRRKERERKSKARADSLPGWLAKWDAKK